MIFQKFLEWFPRNFGAPMLKFPIDVCKIAIYNEKSLYGAHRVQKSLRTNRKNRIMNR
jgi:hypothetical protein